MSEELKRIEQLEKEIRTLKGLSEDNIPTFSFSSIKFEELESVVHIENSYDMSVFKSWFHQQNSISSEDIAFLQNLIDINILLISDYHEEDLKVNFIVPLLTKVNFFMLDRRIRSFYNEKLTYKTDKFIFNGETDFVVSNGLKKATNPYFFIQEFKRGKVNTDPQPQLLAELISAVELNNEREMKGAYIIGENWNFVILEKLGKERYRYFVSRTFNCTNIEDLKGIYWNLLFVKGEIIESVKNG